MFSDGWISTVSIDIGHGSVIFRGFALVVSPLCFEYFRLVLVLSTRGPWVATPSTPILWVGGSRPQILGWELWGSQDGSWGSWTGPEILFYLIMYRKYI